MNYRKYIYSGPVCEIEEIVSFRQPGETYTRRKGNQGLTPEQQQEFNEQNARKKLSRLINGNFAEEDLFITLTYACRPKKGEPEKELKNYFRRLRDYRRKNALPEIKWIAVTETGEKGREHHHLIMSGMSRDAATKLWKLGRVLSSNLDGGDYTGLAHYITKEKPEEHKRRWSSSRNLKKPIVKYKKIKRIDPKRIIPTPKGYRMLDYQVYSSERTGTSKYLKCIREGAVDLAEGGGRLPDEDDNDTG
jgi:hypothetical protein